MEMVPYLKDLLTSCCNDKGPSGASNLLNTWVADVVEVVELSQLVEYDDVFVEVVVDCKEAFVAFLN